MIYIDSLEVAIRARLMGEANSANQTSTKIGRSALRRPRQKGHGRTLKASEAVALGLVQEIVEQGLKPGSRLPMEAELADEYEVSRPSMREALRLLEFQGLIRRRPGPGAGTVVGEAHPHNLARTIVLYLHLLGVSYPEILETYSDTQAIIGERAAANPDRLLVEELLTPFIRPIEELDEEEKSQATGAVFHESMYRLADNAMSALLAKAVSVVAVDHVLPSVPPMVPDIMINDHREIALAVIAGDQEAAARLMREHIAHIIERFREHWPDRIGQKPDWNMFK